MVRPKFCVRRTENEKLRVRPKFMVRRNSVVDRSSVLKLEEIDERAGVDGSVFYPLIYPM